MRPAGRDKQRRRVAMTVVSIAVVAVIVGAVLSLTTFIDRKLNQSAEQQVLTFTEQEAGNVADRVNMVQNAIGCFTIQTDDPVSIVPALRALQDCNGFASVAFAGMDGQGRSSDGSPFSVNELPQPDVALLQGEQAYSDTYVNDEGIRVRLAQDPLYIDGVQVGALYVEIPLSLFSMPVHLDMFDGRGYFMLFEADSGEILVSPSDETETPLTNDMLLYDFLETASHFDESTTLDSVGGAGALLASQQSPTLDVENLRALVEGGSVGLLSSRIDGRPSYICVAPVDGGQWYVCSVVPVENVRAEVAVVTTTFQVVFGIVFACLLIVGILVFFTYRRRMRERNVAMMSQLYKAMSDSIDLAVNLYSPSDGQVTRIVAKAANIIGYPLDDFLKNDQLANDIGLSERGRILFDRIRSGEVRGFERGEFSFCSPRTGATSWASYTISPLVFDDKSQLLVVLRDTTADKAIQLSMKEAMDAAEAANEAKSEFLSRMSHEIRTPMNVIIGMLQIAQGNVGDAEKMRRSLGKIGAASDHLLSLINDVLDISKIENGKMTLASEPFRLLSLIDEVTGALRPQCELRNQTFLVDVSGVDDAVLVGDSVRIRQLLINLLTNAMKYTPVGGCIRLMASASSGAVMGYRQITFIVADDGIGMSKDFQEHLFEPFVMEGRSRAQGTGLGMPIVKNIVSMMGGFIFVESAIGEGTTFKVVINLRVALEAERVAFEARENTPSEEGLPAAVMSYGLDTTMETRKGASPVASAPVTSSQNSDAVELEGLHVLIAEDNELNAEIACELLSGAGLLVDHASDGQEACDLFAASPVGFYDTVLMDVQMPIMNGYDATRCIRRLERSDATTVPIIAMSANAFSEDVNASLESGMNAHLSKPIDMRLVLSTIAKYIRIRREAEGE